MALALLFAGAGPAAAQESEVMRQAFTFGGSSLRVDIASETAGQLRLIRGNRNRVEVSGRARDGFVSAALGGATDGRLTLTSVGPGRAEFIVVVPERVRVRIYWTDSGRNELFGALSTNTSYSWNAPRPHPSFETIRPADSRSEPREADERLVTRLDGPTPAYIDVERGDLLESLTVRIGRDAFAVWGSGAFRADRESDEVLLEAVRGGALTVRIPADQDAVLALEGRPIIILDDGETNLLCGSATAQVLEDGSRWITLAPVELSSCGEPQTDPRNRIDRRRT